MSTLLSRLPARTTAVLALCLLIPAAALSQRDARIRLPEQFASASARIELDGFSGYNRGDYRGGEFSGAFTRIESRLGVFDPLYVANRGKSGFTIDDDAGQALIAADCRAIQRTAGVKFVEIDLKKLAYDCAYTGSAASGEMRFVLGEPKRKGFREKLLARDRRVGEAEISGRSYVFESVHEYDGSRFDSQSPLGYLIESEGAVIAAVDLLDWDPIVHLHESLTADERRSAMTVALSLAVLRDPSNSVLEDLADLD